MGEPHMPKPKHIACEIVNDLATDNFLVGGWGAGKGKGGDKGKAEGGGKGKGQ